MAEIFVVKNKTAGDIELKDFGVIIGPDLSVDLKSTERAKASAELDGYLSGGDLVRVIGDVEVAYAQAFVCCAGCKNWILPLSDGSQDNAGDQTFYMVYNGHQATEAEAQTRMPASKVRAVNIYVSENTLIGASTVKLRKNGQDTNLTFQIGAGATGLIRGTDEIAFADGDLLSVSMALGANGGKIISFGQGSVEVQS